MVNRVYILLDIVDGKAEHVTQVLRESPGVVTVDVLEGPPDVIIAMEAAERDQLAKLAIQALVSVETMTKDVCLLPAKPGLNASFLTSLSSRNRSKGKRKSPKQLCKHTVVA